MSTVMMMTGAFLCCGRVALLMAVTAMHPCSQGMIPASLVVVPAFVTVVVSGIFSTRPPPEFGGVAGCLVFGFRQRVLRGWETASRFAVSRTVV